MLLHPETQGSARDTSPRCGAACKQRRGVRSAISLRDNCDHLLSPPQAGPNSPSSFSCTKLGQGTGPINMPSCPSAREKNTQTQPQQRAALYMGKPRPLAGMAGCQTDLGWGVSREIQDTGEQLQDLVVVSSHLAVNTGTDSPTQLKET